MLEISRFYGIVIRMFFVDHRVPHFHAYYRVAAAAIGVFATLQDKSYFAKVRVNGESGTIEWPNGVDWAPDVFYRIGKDV